MFSIREAKITDNQAINRVSSHLGYDDILDAEVTLKLQRMLSSGVDFIYVAEINQVLAGWIHLFLARRLASPDFIEIGGLVVSPEFRKQGVARSLISYARQVHPGKLRVRCNDERKETHEFYEATGFQVTKRQRIFEFNVDNGVK